jgi:hypothetical protein
VTKIEMLRYQVVFSHRGRKFGTIVTTTGRTAAEKWGREYAAAKGTGYELVQVVGLDEQEAA